ncbi:hypothetical protein G3I59_45250 [Amycolatopsis rubida]|uniref:XRE family transcriptional regulator n=1 Tax=Amycolatopsis rubida TaxID=112413 RepID=A0ABX0CCF2_9PSEU|nr:hypothetical protein [Amycolatopsis rubida]MYW97635.1 hypothetical protein [Amycolatopsis rubida]NEC62620.1 hypothetical protein [Amycolatopsis rubida]
MRLFAPAPGGERLAQALAEGPFERALTLAIERSGLGLARLRERLAASGVPVSTTTLSSWRTGRSRPERPESLRALALLEPVLDVPPGALRALLDRPRTGSPAPRAARWDRLWENRSLLPMVLNSFEDSSPESVSVHETLHVDAAGRMRSLHVREVLRALDEPAFVRIVALRGFTPGQSPELVSARYCRPGCVRATPEQAFSVTELVLDHPLAPGETGIVEYRFAFRDEEPDARYDRRFRLPIAEHLLEVHFDPAALPAECLSYRQDSPTGPELETAEVRVRPGVPAHVIRTGQGAGIHGVRWRW